jgi:glycosyltransferase involved in cell wall biosynthesis
MPAPWARIASADAGTVDELRALLGQIGPDVILPSWPEAAEAKDRFLAGSDVLVLPWREEAFQMATLEAMSDGMPVVATPVGGIPDVSAHDRDGLLVHVGDQAALRAAMALSALDAALQLSLRSAARAKADSLNVAHSPEWLLRPYRSVIMQQPAGAVRGRHE